MRLPILSHRKPTVIVSVMELNIDLSKNIASAVIWSHLLFKTKLICKAQRKSVAPIVEFCFAFLLVCLFWQSDYCSAVWGVIGN